MLLQRSYKKDAVQVFQFGNRVIGQPKMTTHIYFVDGLLIDTGQSRLKKKILDTTSSLDIKKIFITHHHEDHSGNISEIKKQQNCNVYTTSKCSALMQNPPKLSFVQKITWGNLEKPWESKLIRRSPESNQKPRSNQSIPKPETSICLKLFPRVQNRSPGMQGLSPTPPRL